MGEEPRAAYNNRAGEDPDYKQLIEDPWFGALSAVSTANDIIIALADGVTIDDGGDADKNIEASAYLLRGLSTGYLGLMFDKGYRATEDTDVSQPVDFLPYTELIVAAEADLNQAISIASSGGDGFGMTFFNGLTLTPSQFIELAHSYAARF